MLIAIKYVIFSFFCIFRYLANEKLIVMPKSLFDVAYDVDTRGWLICLS